MPTSTDSLADKAVQALRHHLGPNLYSFCLYGSAVRGNFIEGISDINLLIVLNESNPGAHQAVARAIGGEKEIDPFVLGRAGFARSARVFGSKFASIQRHHRVLHGPDPLAGLAADPALERFLCEQALRNLRLRLVYAFVTRARTHGYRRFLLRTVTPLFVQFSEVLRLEGLTVPKEFEARVPLMEKQFHIDGEFLIELLAAKEDPDDAGEEDDEEWHERLFPMVDAVVNWVEATWNSR